jgi:hypothetical protein
MSQEYADLVFKLGRPGVENRRSSSSVAMRETLVLMALAVRADDEGRCTLTVGELCPAVPQSVQLIRDTLTRLARRGLITVIANPGLARTFQLNREALIDNRYGGDGADSLFTLVDYGLDDRSLSCLTRYSGYASITELGKDIEAYQRLLPSDQRGLHLHLEVRNLGRQGGANVLAAYEQWARAARLARGSAA